MAFEDQDIKSQQREYLYRYIKYCPRGQTGRFLDSLGSAHDIFFDETLKKTACIRTAAQAADEIMTAL